MEYDREFTGQQDLESPLKEMVESLYPLRLGVKIEKVDRPVWHFIPEVESSIYDRDVTEKVPLPKEVKLREWDDGQNNIIVWLAYVAEINTLFWMPG